jgi:5-oxoprolinase (ATP-hydrolysing) subunit C
MMIEVLKPGLETTVQDYPGRVGMLKHGVPPSGPLDDWSFRLANLVVGNDAGTAALECQFVGPALRFTHRAVISVCGADMSAKLDSVPIPMWTSVAVEAGQVLSLAGASIGARAYIAVAGGIDVPVVMGSRSTYVTARLGGVGGSALAAGQTIGLFKPRSPIRPGRVARTRCRPALSPGKLHEISAVSGPKDDWISPAGLELFYAADWKLTSRSNRVGFRIQGPQPEFAERAFNKSPENGEHPSNIIDIGYPVGGINWAGETPIILMHDCITLGGFIVPFTVPSSEFWKLAQARPGDVLRFTTVGIDQAQRARMDIDRLCSPDSIDA